jgi:DMSO reductase anchor subunit
MGIYGIGIVFLHERWAPIGWLGALLAVATIFSTSMIYAQLKTVPRWNHWTTPALFLGYSLAGGAYLASKVDIAIHVMLALAVAQIVVWIIGDGLFKAAGSTLESATGLGRIGKARMFEAPHSSKNYLMTEMVHVIGRKHSLKLRIIALVLLIVLPYLILEFVGFSHLTMIPAFLSLLAGLLVIRWLFFAEAEHVVGLYYDKR